MDDNNFTYLDDILDLEEPGNDNENKSEYSPTDMYSQYSAPPSDMKMSHDVNTIRSSLSTQEMFRSSPDMSSRIQYLPKSSQNNNRYGHYANNIEQYNPPPSYPEPHIHQQSQVHEQLPGYVGKDHKHIKDDMSNARIQELTDKYDELCYICKKLNDKDRVRYHYIYNIIIIFLFLVILMLIKKVFTNLII